MWYTATRVKIQKQTQAAESSDMAIVTQIGPELVCSDSHEAAYANKSTTRACEREMH